MVNPKRKINIGLIGLGRLGKVYARDLSRAIVGVRLVAVADTAVEAAQQVAADCEVPRWYADPLSLLDDREIEAVVIVTPTHTHREIVEAAVARRKAVLCEKPLSLTLEDAVAMQRAVQQAGCFFQMGFMRRFDRGYADNAMVSLKFAGGGLGAIDLSRNGVYGYDINTEILGTSGTMRIGYLQ